MTIHTGQYIDFTSQSPCILKTVWVKHCTTEQKSLFQQMNFPEQVDKIKTFVS